MLASGPSRNPVQVSASTEPSASRGLWLIKWLLLVPHAVVLAFLWLGFVAFSVMAFFAILFTGTYPRVLFDYNVGVLRWTWRVQYYGYGALGTDRYPPFTLAEVPGYPANLTVDYPQRLSRGLVLVKWWLLAIPHYLILAVFIGGGVWLGVRSQADIWGAGGLVTLLVILSAIALLFTGRYPRSLYDLVLGMDRWALRVAAYASLMTDQYPPFRLDIGGTEPRSGPTNESPALAGGPKGGAPEGVGSGTYTWTGGRIVAVVAGAVLILASTGLLGAGGALLWADQTQRVGAYVMGPSADISTPHYAIASSNIELLGTGFPWVVDNIIGTARLEATPATPHTAIFIGVARSSDVTRYLQGVAYREVPAFGTPWSLGLAMDHRGGRPIAAPGSADFWVATASGSGTQALTWRPDVGNWTVVVMRTGGGAAVDATVRLGATLPGLPWIIAGLFAVGAVLVVGGGFIIGIAVRKASRVVGDHSASVDKTSKEAA